ncbi:uncharacterized protein Z518_00317 [Rhinocladiella mackenziei CBS 650.93]|uniref:Rhinocladiella mackenziei CBS 650.93 unplaced genomic scaffold supercont1.1, whole genome shotgun sequence n=1 Tax=Rhinocladiella mackenziei CBS 650.93 TaxID=1442369 RepID=A0A0D2HEX4_9EURO|nr:uncharacterized protein Z518_00317 [Rhinocladiella mackenziei CBS 650.93]KIX09238.1 hypothetical protein Z518_00317 [Rhinocladiella mackenziei CBS 650.93]
MADSSWNSQQWPFWWRAIILLNVSFYNLLGNAYAAGVPPLFQLIIEDFHVSQEAASQLSTYVLLALGLSNIFALPLSALIGKRYTVVFSLAVFLASCIWSGEAGSYGSLKASRIVGGLGGGLIEALGPRIVVETFPERQLASAMVVYVGFLAAGSAVGPIVAGAVAQDLGNWRWYMRILSIAIFCNLLGAILMLPETTHEIQPNDEHIRPNKDSETPGGEPHDDKEQNDQRIESVPGVGKETVSYFRSHSLRKEYIDKSFSTQFVSLNWRTAMLLFIQPAELFLAPQVLLAILVFGLTIGWTVVTSILTASVYAAPPLLWSALSVGLLSIAPLVGIIIGLPIGGAFADILSGIARRRSGGEHNPATRLPVAILGALVSPAGCLLIGYGLKDPASEWFRVCAGWCMLSVGLTGSANVLLTYAVDCLPTRAGHIGVLINLTKNCLGFGVSYASITWMQTAGPVSQMATMAGILWGAYLLVIPMGLFSKTLMKKTSWLEARTLPVGPVH